MKELHILIIEDDEDLAKSFSCSSEKLPRRQFLTTALKAKCWVKKVSMTWLFWT